MNQLLAAALEVQRYLDGKEWSSCVIGGLAVLRWGEPRTTQDVDITLLTGFGREEQFIDPLLSSFASRIQDARAFALSRRVLLLKTTNEVAVDISLGGLPFEMSVVNRSSFFEFADGCAIRTCSAEDLIVLKAFASRPQDWRDVEGVLVRQGSRLDLVYVRNELAPLAVAKDQPDIMSRLESTIREMGST